jgi:hypothetical protein
MKSIKLKNDRLKILLSSTIDLFYNNTVEETSKRCKDRIDDLIPEFDPCSEEYLKKAFTLELKEYGFPRALRGLSLSDMQHFIPNSSNVVEISKRMSQIGRFLGTPNQALTMYYPENGHIGWHHNGNAPGYNILITHSTDGDGGFSFWDYKTKSIKTIPDQVGWSVKVGYYPNQKKEPKRVYWHMAKTKNPRISIAWVIDQKEMWKNMIDEITLGDYDHGDILDQ